MSRVKPYHTNQLTWRSVLSTINIIPMNQRNYDWDERPQLNKFMQDLFEMFESGYNEVMGTIIYYIANKDGKEIWDGQQRTITVILILLGIARIVKLIQEQSSNDDSEYNGICESICKNINSILKEDRYSAIYRSERTLQFQNNPKLKSYTDIPKIYCVNPYDNQAICDIFNAYDPLITHYTIPDEIIDDISSDDDELYAKINITKFKCKTCNATINSKGEVNRKQDFIRHLKQLHAYDDSKIRNTNTKIYNAYEYICTILYLRFRTKPIQEFNEFYQFILDNVDITVYECNDAAYVSKIFEWFNNRGKDVISLDVIKNILLANISDDKKYEVYDKWNKIKDSKCDIYSQYGQRIMNIAIQLFNKRILRKCDQEELFRSLVTHNKDQTYANIQQFFQIATELDSIMCLFKNDRFGRLITHTKKCSIAWDAYMFLLLPAMWCTKQLDKNLIKLMVKWFYRNVGMQNRNFNNLCYSNVFIDTSNKIIANPSYDYLDEIIKVLHKNKDVSISYDNYVKNNIEKDWTKSSGTSAKMLLLFYETTETTDDNFPILDHDLEHIYPINKKNALQSPDNVYKLGNLTLLEAKNSQNGHQGNRSIQDKNFDKKKKSYKDSIHKITRDLCKFDRFEEDSIIKRTQMLFNRLNDITDY